MKLDSDYDSESDAGILLAIGGENESDPHLHNEKSYSSPDPKRAKLLPVKDSAQPITDVSFLGQKLGLVEPITCINITGLAIQCCGRFWMETKQVGTGL